jgi:carboxylesterase
MNEQKPQRSWIRQHPIWVVTIAIIGALALLLLYAWFMPFSIDAPVSNPAQSYEDSIARIEAIQAAENARGDVLPECRTTLMTHGDKTDHVVVFMHGYTSCPEQFRQLGQEFFDKGYNVYIPRQPYHGLQEQIDNELRYLTTEDLAAYGTDAADIAQGLGEHVTVAGLSGGGSIASWLAQYRTDVDVAAPIAPFLGIGFIPQILNRPFTNLAKLVPTGFYMWWDPKNKADNPVSAPYSYPRYSLRSLAEVLRLGYAAEEDVKTTPPASKDIIVIYNAADSSVNNGIIEEFIELWEAHGAALLTTYEFERSLGLPHDLITSTRPGNRIDLAYPVIRDLLENAQ